MDEYLIAYAYQLNQITALFPLTPPQNRSRK